MRFQIDTELLAAASSVGPIISRNSADVAGNAVCDDGLMIDVSPMKSVHVDPTACTARAEGGIPWGECDHETRAFGQATTGGLMGSYGLSSDKLLSVDIVTADRKLLQAGAGENPDRV
jgi:FAD/FMN-containing dehydrogenase